MKKRVTKSVAKGMKAALDVVLQTEANNSFMCDYVSAKSTERINEIQEKQVMEK